MTPNIHAHYTDHGMLQFCPVKLEDDVVVNPGSTVMPLTQYRQKSCLRPFSVTLKGQQLQQETSYFGNPCQPVPHQTAEKVAVLFPGQGSQYPGMLDNYIHLASAQEIVQTASEVFGFDVELACSIGNNMEEKAQLLVFVVSLAAAEAMKQHHPLEYSRVRAVGGFSLGEITALCFAGAVSLRDALRLVRVRSEAMEACHGGSMCNVRGIIRKDLEQICRSTETYIANIICDNDECPQENIFVCAGSKEAIETLMNRLSNDSVRTRRLRVRGAFHSKYMKPAQLALSTTLNEIELELPAHVLLYSNVTGQPYTSVKEMRALLTKQICKPVQWHAILQDMTLQEDITKFYELGPMNTLSKMGKTFEKSTISMHAESTNITDSSSSDIESADGLTWLDSETFTRK